ncbi:MAG: hypothetical protein ACM37W_27190 [Actinomycetota bacterium]
MLPLVRVLPTIAVYWSEDGEQCARREGFGSIGRSLTGRTLGSKQSLTRHLRNNLATGVDEPAAVFETLWRVKIGIKKS